MTTLILKNQLGSEKSPYLLQHRDNPVWWFPWGREAFDEAKRQDKPIFLSIGYATCYWCHVMEKDSFEQQEIADILNANFISIKLDREERPDIDGIYMEAVMGMTGHGGWPMSVFLTPDRRPFWGGTFFYRAQFKQILERINDLWRGERDKIGASASHISEFLDRRAEAKNVEGANPDTLDVQVVDALNQNFDQHYGGFGSKPKFPPSSQLAYLARVREPTLKPLAEVMHDVTLDRMARGGIFDQLGGGFARYSTDERWLIPHFEKMLYDNALLAVSYFEGWQKTKQEPYLEIGDATLQFMERELLTREGAFASALDAGEVGNEGEYYVWAAQEIRDALTDEEFKRIECMFTVRDEGNFEAKHTVLSIALDHQLAERQDPIVVEVRRKLFALRERRKRPFMDDKILTGWNGLAISAFAIGAKVTRKEAYKKRSLEAASFLYKNMVSANGIKRRFREGEARFDGCLEDYAYLAAGFIDLGLALEDYQWLERAREIQALQNKILWDEKSSAYEFSSSADQIVRKKEFVDGAMPSANAISLLNLQRLAVFFADPTYADYAQKLDAQFLREAKSYPQEFCRYLLARKWLETNQQAVIVVGKGAALPEEIRQKLNSAFAPDWTILFKHEGNSEVIPLLDAKKAPQGQVLVYICNQQGCGVPVQLTEFMKLFLQQN